MLDRITGLNVFSRIAALGSLSAAARALGMSQTMATKHMAALEAHLGTKLVHRTTRRLTLTEAGRTYLEATERILADLDDADRAATTHSVEVRGTLRLNAPVSFGLLEIAPLLPAFAALYPALVLDLGLNDRYVDLVEEGWDVAIRIGSLTDQSMIARRLAPCRTVVCAAPSYLARHGTPRTVADLAGHNCLGYTLSRTIGTNRWAFGSDRKTTVATTGSLTANNGDALIVAAVAGLGLIYQPTFLVRHQLASGALVQLTLDHPPIELDGVFATYPANRRPPAKVRAFIDFLVAQFTPMPPWERPSPPPSRG